MHIDGYVALAGLLVGFTVGLTGMGGGALMTPILVLLFKVQPLAAVSSDLVASLVMKPVGASVHMRRGTVKWNLVRWLVLGSVPAAFGGVILIKQLGDGAQVQDRVELALGAALLLAAITMIAKSFLQGRAARRDGAAGRDGSAMAEAQPIVIRPFLTVVIGVVGGFVVGMTSVGSGSLIIVALLLLYPKLRARNLVGTDLVQAIPIVAAASIGHILYGDFQLSLTASILIGSVPGVYLGAKLSSRAPDGVVRPALVFVLVASALKLLGLPTVWVGITLLAFVLVAFPIWGAVDAAIRTERQWAEAGVSRRTWVGAQAATAPFGVGFALAVAYFASIRPKLTAERQMPAAELVPA